MTSRLLRIAFLITYFGDYCSLIGLMEYAKRFGQSDKVVFVFIAYCLPPLLMLFMANQWSSRQKRPSKQMAILNFIGGLAVLSLLVASTYTHVILVAVALGFVKEAIRLLVNVYIKQNYSSQGSKKILNDIITIRFFIMIFGASVGGYLGSMDRFDLVFSIDAISYMISGILFLVLKFQPKMVQTKELDFTLFNIKGIKNTLITFKGMPFLWVILSSIAIGSFMALEYPLITTELGISPKFLIVIYTGHVIGTLVARKITSHLLNFENLIGFLILGSILLIASFGVVGIWGSGLALICFQMGVIAVVMVSLEILFDYHLMKKSSQEDYPLYNLYFKSFYKIAMFFGSIAPLLLLNYKMNLLESNIAFNISLLVLGILLSVLMLIYSSRIIFNEAKN